MGPSSKWKCGPLVQKAVQRFLHVLCSHCLSLSDGGLIFYVSTWSLGHRDIWGWVRPSQALRPPPYYSAHRTCAPDRTPCCTDTQEVEVGSDCWGKEGSRRLRTYPGEAGRQRWRPRKEVCLGAEAAGPWLIRQCPVRLDLQNSNSKRIIKNSKMVSPEH